MASKKKPMTKAEKKFQSQIKKDMQERGILPPDKPKLNRKKYIEEARNEWNEKDNECHVWELYLHEAICLTLELTDRQNRASPEAVGVAKTLKLAIRLKEFHDKVKKEGRDTYKIGEYLEYIQDILDA